MKSLFCAFFVMFCWGFLIVALLDKCKLTGTAYDSLYVQNCWLNNKENSACQFCFHAVLFLYFEEGRTRAHLDWAIKKEKVQTYGEEKVTPFCLNFETGAGFCLLAVSLSSLDGLKWDRCVN